MGPQSLKSFSSVLHHYTCSAGYFLEVGARVSLKVATKGSHKGKKTLEF